MIHNSTHDFAGLTDMVCLKQNRPEGPSLIIDRNPGMVTGTMTPHSDLDVRGDVRRGNDVTIWQGLKALYLRQDNTQSCISNTGNYVGNGSESNGSLNIIGEGGINLRYYLGTQVMPVNTSGSSNVIIGYQAGYLNYTGSRNIFLREQGRQVRNRK